jgi:hypothetical protein
MTESARKDRGEQKKKVENTPASSPKQMDMEEDSDESFQSMVEQPSLGKPINPISDMAKERLLEYTIQLSFRTNNLLTSRDKLVEITNKTSILKASNVQVNEYGEHMTAEIFTPVDNLYDTILAFNVLGDLTGENVQTVDWTEQNEQQKIRIQREDERSRRRNKAGSAGSAANWTWKDREELLERSEDSLDEAKLEAWKIKDKVRWAKININMIGKETPLRIKFPNFRNAFVSSINFILEGSYLLFASLPLLILGYALFRVYKWYKNRY